MNNIEVLVGIPASDPAEQVRLLTDVPADIGVRGFYASLKHKPLAVLLAGLCDASYDPDSGAPEMFHERTQFEDGHSCSALSELACLAKLIRHSLKPEYLLTEHALKTKIEWKVVRRLAIVALEELGVSNRVTPEEAATLLGRLKSNPCGTALR